MMMVNDDDNMQGVKLGLEGEIEKHSDVLGRTVPWNKKMEISSLPKYLCVEVCFLFLNSIQSINYFINQLFGMIS